MHKKRVKVPLTSQIVFAKVNVRYFPDYFGETKVFGPAFFLQMLYLFKASKLGAYFGPWTTIQENGSCLLWNVMPFFHSSKIPDSYIVFALHRRLFFNDHRPE